MRRFLAFYYLQTALVAKLSAPVNPSVIDIAENRAILDNTALKIMWNKSNHNFSKLLVVVKLLNIVVGEEVKEAFSADKIPSIRLVLKEVLGKMKRKLPSVQTGLKTNNIITLAQLHSHLDVVIDRWTSGCGDNWNKSWFLKPLNMLFHLRLSRRFSSIMHLNESVVMLYDLL